MKFDEFNLIKLYKGKVPQAGRKYKYFFHILNKTRTKSFKHIISFFIKLKRSNFKKNINRIFELIFIIEFMYCSKN